MKIVPQRHRGRRRAAAKLLLDLVDAACAFGRIWNSGHPDRVAPPYSPCSPWVVFLLFMGFARFLPCWRRSSFFSLQSSSWLLESIVFKVFPKGEQSNQRVHAKAWRSRQLPVDEHHAGAAGVESCFIAARPGDALLSASLTMSNSLGSPASMAADRPSRPREGKFCCRAGWRAGAPLRGLCAHQHGHAQTGGRSSPAASHGAGWRASRRMRGRAAGGKSASMLWSLSAPKAVLSWMAQPSRLADAAQRLHQQPLHALGDVSAGKELHRVAVTIGRPRRGATCARSAANFLRRFCSAPCATSGCGWMTSRQQGRPPTGVACITPAEASVCPRPARRRPRRHFRGRARGAVDVPA